MAGSRKSGSRRPHLDLLLLHLNSQHDQGKLCGGLTSFCSFGTKLCESLFGGNGIGMRRPCTQPFSERSYHLMATASYAAVPSLFIMRRWPSSSPEPSSLSRPAENLLILTYLLFWIPPSERLRLSSHPPSQSQSRTHKQPTRGRPTRRRPVQGWPARWLDSWDG